MSAPSPVFQRIIVPIDASTASEQAIPFAAALAGPGDRIVLLHAINPHDAGRSVLLGRRADEHSIDDERDAAQTHLTQLAVRVPLPDEVAIETRIVEGKPAEAITGYAVESGAAMIVMTTAGRGAAGRLAFGSVADQVARTSPVPVVLVRLRDQIDPPPPVHLERVLLPMDGSERAGRALEPAAAVARRLDLPIVVLYVMEISDLTAYGDPAHTPTAIEAQIAGEDEAVRTALASAVEELQASGVDASWKVLSGGWAAEAIEDEIGPSDFVVMSSHGRVGLRRWLFGSVSEQLVRSGRSPVMLVPAGS